MATVSPDAPTRNESSIWPTWKMPVAAEAEEPFLVHSSLGMQRIRVCWVIRLYTPRHYSTSSSGSPKCKSVRQPAQTHSICITLRLRCAPPLIHQTSSVSKKKNVGCVTFLLGSTLYPFISRCVVYIRLRNPFEGLCNSNPHPCHCLCKCVAPQVHTGRQVLGWR